MRPEQFQLSLADIVIIVGETLFVVIVGLCAARKTQRTTEGYFLASGTMPWWLIGAAFVSTSVSSEQIVGTVGATYKGGLAIANWEWWCLPTYLLVVVFFIPLYLRNRIMTVPELLNRRFGPVCGGLYSGVMLLGYVFIFLPPVLSARSTWDGMMGIIFAGFINLARPLVTCLLGLIVYHWLNVMQRGPTLLPDRQDQAFAYALATFAPSGIRGVILAGFFAAVMSTVSALANAVATIFSLDVYRQFWRKNAGDAELIATGRIAAGMALALAALAAPAVAKVGLLLSISRPASRTWPRHSSPSSCWASSGRAQATLAPSPV
ncbi:MAG: hypothetical protein HY735_04320 [Verrucomicrobia bacterium]|nr:hypothetical protein [Verrucomicrobiota bacterium]